MSEVEVHITTIRRLKVFHDGGAKKAMQEVEDYLKHVARFLSVLEVMGESLDVTSEEHH